METSRGIWVAPEEIELSSRKIAGLPVVNAVLGRLGFDELIVSHLPEPDPRCGIEPARAISILVRNLALGREPLYGLGHWATGFEPVLLGLSAREAGALNDDCVGRALDALFASDRASLLTVLSLRAIAAYSIALTELHDDSTSLCLYGAYQDAKGEPRADHTSSPGAGVLEGPQAGLEATRLGPHHLGRWRYPDHLSAPRREHRGLDHPHRHLGALPSARRRGGLPLRRRLQTGDV